MKRTKQITRWIIALAGLMIATGAVQAQQYDFKYGGLYYKITKKTGIVFYEVKVVPEKAASPYYSDGNEPTGAVTIPKDFTRKVGDFFCSYTVTEIGDNAFFYCKGITSVSIPNSVKTIGWWAFANCTGLKSVTLPNGIQEIGGCGFRNCALQSIDIPASVKTIGKVAFAGCKALQSIDIPASVKTIEERAFMDCTALKSVTLPNGIQEIGEWAFSECKALQSIDIPASVKTIGKVAFANCTGLKSVTLPNGIQEIGGSAFAHCKALQSIDIPASVKTIGQWAFMDCTALKSVTLPNGIQEIGLRAFSGCTALQSIDIPASVTTIGEEAFENCTGLKTVTVHWDAPLAVPDNVFEDVNTDNVTLKVPKGKEAAYKAHAVWGKFKFEGGSTPPPPPPVVQVTSVTLSHHEVTVNGDITQKQLTATVQPATATNKSLTWKSSDAAVASVDADGLVTIHKKGKATVTATANDGSGHSDACLFDVISTVANETIDGLRIFAADGALHLTLPAPATVHIYHVSGAMVKTLALPAGDHVLPLPSGVYVVRVGERVTKILIK